MIRGLTFSGRERRLALMAGVVCGSWLLVVLGLQPLWQRGGQLREHVARQAERLQGMGRLLAQERSIEASRQQLEPFFSMEPEQDAQALLEQLETLSRTTSVRLNLKPKTVTSQRRQPRLEIELEVEGSQDAILRFLDGIIAMPRLITIEQMRLAHAPTKDRALRANLVIQQVLVR